MHRIPIAGLVALLGTSACYSYVSEPPAAPQWSVSYVSGPPGGAIDPGYGAGYGAGDGAGDGAQDPIYTDPAAPGAGAPGQPYDLAGTPAGSDACAARAPGAM